MKYKMNMALIYDKENVMRNPMRDLDVHYDENLDTYQSVLADICSQLDNIKGLQFHVSGFGLDPWNVDCQCDLLSIIDQVIEKIPLLDSGAEQTEIQFYEQGTERTIMAQQDGTLIHVSCVTLSGNLIGTPEEMDRNSFIQMLKNMEQDFITLAQFVCPNLWNNPLLQNWLSELNISF